MWEFCKWPLTWNYQMLLRKNTIWAEGGKLRFGNYENRCGGNPAWETTYLAQCKRNAQRTHSPLLLLGLSRVGWRDAANKKLSKRSGDNQGGRVWELCMLWNPAWKATYLNAKEMHKGYILCNKQFENSGLDFEKPSPNLKWRFDLSHRYDW